MTSKPALWAHAELLQRLLSCLARPLSNLLGSLQDAGLELVEILQSWDFRGNNTKNEVLVPGQMAQRLKSSGAGIVILQVEGIEGFRFSKQGFGDLVVGPGCEVA